MNLIEGHGKQVFKEFGIPVPQGGLAGSPEEAVKVAESIGRPVVIKAQVKTGGRGKAGGVKFAEGPDDARKVAAEILGMSIKGLKVESVLVEEQLTIKGEIYAGITVDRGAGRPVVMVSPAGGVDIEEVAKETPNRIYKRDIDPFIGMQPYMAREFAARLGLAGEEFKAFTGILLKLYRVFTERDATLAEINPLVVAEEGVFAADAKLVIDDDALYRQTFEKKEKGLPYVELEGNIGCIVNGAGLAMSTMDTLKHLGGEPANFLDIGGGASSEVMKKALEQVAAHPSVKVIFINILGGITRCDEIARGILGAISDIDTPVVVRFRGTNEEEGVAILKEEGFEVERDMIKAAEKAIEVGSK
jgi:succinyl-CoA synthetase beta subunit